MRFLGRTSRLRFSLVLGDLVALRICQERWKTNPKEHWMLYYKLHAGCQKPLVLGGFFVAPKEATKSLEVSERKQDSKTTSGIAFLLMIFILFKKWLKHKCFMKKHTYIL